MLLTGTSWRPINTPTTYSSGKLNCWGSREVEGVEPVAVIVWEDGRLIHRVLSAAQKRVWNLFFMLCFRVNWHQARAAELYLPAPSLGHFSPGDEKVSFRPDNVSETLERVGAHLLHWAWRKCWSTELAFLRFVLANAWTEGVSWCHNSIGFLI